MAVVVTMGEEGEEDGPPQRHSVDVEGLVRQRQILSRYTQTQISSNNPAEITTVGPIRFFLRSVL